MTRPPQTVLLENIERAVLARLHELVPEFRAHVECCVVCNIFHEWVRWRHMEGTNEWRARCPATGQEMTMPLRFAEREATAIPPGVDPE